MRRQEGIQIDEALPAEIRVVVLGVLQLGVVPQSLAMGGPGLGACWGERRARALAEQAGFGRFERLDIRSPAMAFYALGA